MPTTASAAVSAAAQVVINEVYGGGGNSGAPLTNDFIELHNTGATAVDLSTWSVQYSSAAGLSWTNLTRLAGSIAPGQYYLVAEAAGTASPAALPTPDVTGTINLSGTAGNVALVDDQTNLTCQTTACATAPSVVDLVGYGDTAKAFAGSAAPAASNATSVARNYRSANTGDNGADFVAGAPTPKAASAGGDTPPPTPTEQTIAEIQGTTDISPLAGAAVTTEGVVTAAYPTGGFSGYTIQTPGTGGALDLSTPRASDGVFVYSPATVGSIAIGDYVQVTGTVTEFNGLTEISTPAGGVTELPNDPAHSVSAVTTHGWPATDAQRESLESMLYRPTGDYTVTDVYSTNQYGEIGLAAGDEPLIQPTDAARPNSQEAKEIAEDNASRAVSLDDGASTNFLSAANQAQTPPYISLTHPVRVTEKATFTKDVVVDYRNKQWDFQPTSQVTPADTADYPATFADNRSATPDAAAINQNGPADLRVSSFNVENYFTTLGESVPGCSSYDDRDGHPITVDTCPGNGPRGAWDQASLDRQQAKIVKAINASGADVAGLEEIENSAVLGQPTDAALAHLVDALNADAGPGTWAYVPSSTELPPVDQMDVINCAIIYRPAKVTRTGASRALGTQSADSGADSGAFVDAREPIAQVFTPKAAGGQPFLFVVNHFKSKGSAGPFPGDADTGDGQGASNQSRVKQAQALRDWVPTVLAGSPGTKAVVMVGDYNSYSQEDPVQVLTDAGYVDTEAHYADQSGARKYSYSFDGLSGSLDHVFVNADALQRTTGADTWNINAGESIALNFSRYNSHGTLFWDPTTPYAASDHDPVVVGLRNAAPTTAAPVITSVSVADGDRVSGVKTFRVTFAGKASGLASTYIELNRNGVRVTDNTTPTAVALGSTEAGRTPQLVVDTRTLVDGSYGLKIDAVGTNGQVTEKRITFTIHNAPVLGFVTPAAGATVSGTAQIKVKAVSRTLRSYELQLDGTTVQTQVDPAQGTYSYRFDSRNLANGPHTATATAVDAAGNTTTVTEEFLVANPPVLKFLAPHGGGTVRGAVTVSVSLTGQGLQAYNLRLDAAGLQYRYLPAAGAVTFVWDTTTVANGPHTLLATATDTAGHKTTITARVTVANR